MIEGEHAIIMDFGIARSTSRGGSAPDRRLRDADARARRAQGGRRLRNDPHRRNAGRRSHRHHRIHGARAGPRRTRRSTRRRYAFGLIIYDLLTGRRRSEHAVSAVGELQKRLAQPPPPVQRSCPDVPSAARSADHAVHRSPTPANRYQTTHGARRGDRTAGRQRQAAPEQARRRLPYGRRPRACCWRSVRLTSIGAHAPAGHARPGVGRDRRLRKHDWRSDVRRHARTALRLALEGAGFISAYRPHAAAATLGYTAGTAG